MLVKLICFVICVVLFVFYTGYNLDNKCDVWFFFKVYKNVPVFMNTLISFALGVVCTLPLIFLGKLKSKQKDVEKLKEEKIKIKLEKQKQKEEKLAAKQEKLAAKQKNKPQIVVDEGQNSNDEIKK